jgi:hypothetical protein
MLVILDDDEVFGYIDEGVDVLLAWYRKHTPLSKEEEEDFLKRFKPVLPNKIVSIKQGGSYKVVVPWLLANRKSVHLDEQSGVKREGTLDGW